MPIPRGTRTSGVTVSLILTILTMTAHAGPAAVTTDGLQISASWNAINDTTTGVWWSTDATGAVTVGFGAESWPWDADEAKPVMQLLVDRLEQGAYTASAIGEAGDDAPRVGVLVDAEDGDKAIFAVATNEVTGWPWGQPAAAPAWLGDAPIAEVYTLQQATTADAR